MITSKPSVTSRDKVLSEDELSTEFSQELIKSLDDWDNLTWKVLAPWVREEKRLVARILAEAATTGRKQDLAREVHSVEHAMALLGMERVRDLILELIEIEQPDQKAA